MSVSATRSNAARTAATSSQGSTGSASASSAAPARSATKEAPSGSGSVGSPGEQAQSRSSFTPAPGRAAASGSSSRGAGSSAQASGQATATGSGNGEAGSGVAERSTALNNGSGLVGVYNTATQGVVQSQQAAAQARAPELGNQRSALQAQRSQVDSSFNRQIDSYRRAPAPPGAEAAVQRQIDFAEGARARELSRVDDALGKTDDLIRANEDVLRTAPRVLDATDKLGTALDVIGATTNGVTEGINSPATTTAGKVANGLAAGALNFFTGKVTNPVVNAVDSLTGQNISNAYNNTAASVVVGAEAAVLTARNWAQEGRASLSTVETQGLQNLADKQASGDWGWGVQAAAAAGQGLSALTEDASQRSQAMADFSDRALAGDYGPIARGAAWLGEQTGKLVFGG